MSSAVPFVYIFVSKCEIGSLTRAHLITFYVISINGKSVFKIRVKPPFEMCQAAWAALAMLAVRRCNTVNP